MENIKILKGLNDRLTSLLSDPQPGLYTWRMCLADILKEIAAFAPDESPEVSPVIKAECHTDDFKIEVDFNCSPWFKQATDKAITDLINCGFRGDYPADEVAIYMAERDELVKKMFSYLEIITDIGFECSINMDDAIEWIENNRPSLKKVVEDAKVEGWI